MNAGFLFIGLLVNGLRLISLSPAATEDLFAIGAGPHVVAVDSFVRRPPAALQRARVGGVGDADIESIVALRPSAVVYQEIDTPAIAALRKTGVSVMRVPGRTLADDWAAMRQIGALADRSTAADALVRRLQAHLAQGHKKAMTLKRLRVLVVLWGNPVYSAARGSFADDLFAQANLVNVVHETAKPWPMLSPEFVAKLDPDVVLIADHATIIKTAVPWSLLAAVKSRHIAFLHEGMDCGPYIDRLFDDIMQAVSPFRSSAK